MPYLRANFPKVILAWQGAHSGVRLRPSRNDAEHRSNDGEHHSNDVNGMCNVSSRVMHVGRLFQLSTPKR